VRLVTRSDFDGVVCAAILQDLGIVDEILYVHPKDLQDSKIKVNQDDVIANLPYAQGCGLWFDHHSSEHERLKLKGNFEGASKLLPSAAQVIFEYYADQPKYARILKKYRDLIKVVGVADSAQYSQDDILNPQGWTMLAFIADPRTGLGLKRTFRISNFELMKRLPDLLRSTSLEEILALPDFQERIQVYAQETATFKQLLGKHSVLKGNAILIDFRGIKDVPVGNRFIEYVICPAQNISIRIADGKNKKFAMISVGHSIINRTSPVDVGSLTLKYGGGGHKHVGTCQVKYEEVDTVVQEMLQVINP
jgi:oligoribonuclease NrnB/cAMP/cGMP phosphodiesterase (DHH superfamily)